MLTLRLTVMLLGMVQGLSGCQPLTVGSWAYESRMAGSPCSTHARWHHPLMQVSSLSVSYLSQAGQRFQGRWIVWIACCKGCQCVTKLWVGQADGLPGMLGFFGGWGMYF